MLKLSRKDYDAIRQHGEETYPHECCGVLLGRFEDDGTKRCDLDSALRQHPN